jgi:ClpP class serine protease
MAQDGTRGTPQRRLVRPNELLAISHDFVQSDRGAFFWLFGPAVRENERVGDMAVVRVNGPLEHHDDGYGESYEFLTERVKKALCGQDVVDAETRAHRWEDGWEPPEATPPKCVVLRIDSPGGVVSGLNECVGTLRRLAKKARIPLVAFTDEMAASAAYALCCACSKVHVTKASIVGSVGVISTMVDQTSFDKKAGFKFVVLTSGARKADGHVHVPISKEAVAAEQPRVAQLAAQFWGMVKRARGIPVAQIQGYEAGIFLGSEAVEAELADEVCTWDDIVAQYAGTNALAQPGTTVQPSLAQGDSDMALSAEQSLKNALAKEKDPARQAALRLALEAYKKETHQIEKHTKEEGDEEEDEEEEGGNETDRSDDPDKDKDKDDEDEDEEKDEKKSAASPFKKSAKAKSKKSEEDEGEEEESEEAEALVALVRRATGKTGAAAAGALEGLLSKARMADSLAARVEAIEKTRKTEARDAVVDRALSANRITKSEAKTLKKRPMAHVEAFLEARPRGLIYSQSEDMPVPQMQNPDGSSVLPADLERQIVAAVAASEGKITREQILAEHGKRQSSMNGRS